MKTLFLPKLAIFFVTAFLFGCGSSPEDSLPPLGTTSVQAPIAGKVFLGTPIAGVTVWVETLGGRVLTSQQTDATGNFVFPSGAFPEDFRINAEISEGLTVSREVRDFGPDQFMVLNAPTTMVSLLSRAQPGTPLPEIEQSVRRSLDMPDGSSLNIMEESVAYRFSHLAFAVRASENGGLSSYLQGVSEQRLFAQAPFLLRSDILDSPLTGLDPGLASALDQVRSDPRLRRSTRMLYQRGLTEAFGPSGPFKIVRPQFGEVIIGVLGFVGEGVASSVLDGGIDSVYTWVAESLGWHFGTTVTLDEITEQLDGIAGGVDALVAELTAQEIQDGVTAMNSAVADITEGTNSQIAASSSIPDDSYFVDAPTTELPPSEVTNFLNYIQDQDAFGNYQNYLVLIAQWMTGASQLPIGTSEVPFPPIVVEYGYSTTMNMVDLSRQSVLVEGLGIPVNSDTQQFSNFPVRTASYLDQVLEPVEYYRLCQILAANLLAEAAHSSLDSSTTLAGRIQTAQTAVDNLGRSLLSQRGQVPGYPPSDKIFIDLQYGLMWYMDNQAGKTYTSALNYADSFSLDLPNGLTYSDWRLPTFNEAKALQMRGVFAAAASKNTGSKDFGDTVDGLEALGFDISKLNDDGDVWVANWQYVADNIFEDKEWVLESDGLEFRFNHETEDFFYTSDPNQTRQFFMVRTLGDPLIQIDPPNSIAGPVDSWPSALTGRTFDQREDPYIAVFTGFSDESEIVNGKVQLEANYAILVGDENFTLGTSSVTGSDGTSATHTKSSDNKTFFPPTYFLTDDSASATVSSYTNGSYGQITRHSGSSNPTVIRFYAVGRDDTSRQFPTNISGSLDLEGVDTSITTQRLQISPRNFTVSLEEASSGDIVVKQLEATAFYSDKTVASLTDRVTWTVVSTETGQVVPGVEFSTDQPGLLRFTAGTLTTEDLTVTASINQQDNNVSNSGSDTTLLKALIE